MVSIQPQPQQLCWHLGGDMEYTYEKILTEGNVTAKILNKKKSLDRMAQFL